MIQIRKAQPQDIDSIAELMFLAMEEIVYFFLGTDNKEEGISFLQQHIAAHGNQYSLENIIVAEENQVILGQICIYEGRLLQTLRKPILDYLATTYGKEVLLEQETQSGETYIDTIAVADTARGRGIGNMLLLYAIDLFVNQRGEVLGLLVDKENPNAKRLYLKVGFQIKETKTIFGKEMDHLQYLTAK